MSIPWLPDELSFIAEETVLVKITPHFTSSSIQLLSGVYGPFNAGRPAKVPLWFALFLNSSQSCKLNPPKWLNINTLKKVVDKEKQDKDTLTKLPKHYMEISFIFINRASNIISDIDQVRALIEDIWDLRVEKLRRSIITGSSESNDQIHMENADQMEIHLFRHPITKITDILTSFNELIPPVEQIFD